MSQFPAWMSTARQKLAQISPYGEKLANTRGRSLEELAKQYPFLSSTLTAFNNIKESISGGHIPTQKKARINWEAFRQLEPKKGVVDAFKKLYDERVRPPPADATPEERKKYLYPKEIDLFANIWNANTLNFLEKRSKFWEAKADYAKQRADEIEKEIEEKKAMIYKIRTEGFLIEEVMLTYPGFTEAIARQITDSRWDDLDSAPLPQLSHEEEKQFLAKASYVHRPSLVNDVYATLKDADYRENFQSKDDHH